MPAQGQGPAPFEVHAGDARDLIRDVADHSVDLICTDPPYNLASYSRGNIEMSWRSDFNNDVAAWDQVTFDPKEWVDEVRRVLAPHGNLFAFTSYNLLGRWHEVFDPAFDITQNVVRTPMRSLLAKWASIGLFAFAALIPTNSLRAQTPSPPVQPSAPSRKSPSKPMSAKENNRRCNSTGRCSRSCLRTRRSATK